MKVCIAGGGKVGMYLAQSLLAHRHKVTIIEPQEMLCRSLADSLDIPVICGDAVSFDTMRTADVASCDAFVAVTGADEDNLVACQIAKREFGVDRTVARASNPKNRELLQQRLADASPEKQLARGYSITLKNGKAIKNASLLNEEYTKLQWDKDTNTH